MSWKPIVVGVDCSPAAARAAAVGCEIAGAAGVACHLVYAAPDIDGDAAESPRDAEAYRLALEARARREITARLEARVPPEVARAFEIRYGPPARVLARAVAEYGAELLVLGGKRHGAIARWMGQSTVDTVVRAPLDVPVLAAGLSATGVVKRVLLAVDLSHAARPTLELGQRLARLCGAELRCLHVVEPLPMVPGLPLNGDEEENLRSSKEALEVSIWPLLNRPADRVVRRGVPSQTIAAEAAAWRADVLVIGSHGTGWVRRLLFGNTTERLLGLLPTSLLVVPTPKPATFAPLVTSEEIQAELQHGPN